MDQSDQEAVDMADEYLAPVMDFYDSFAGEAADIWDIVAAPFTKASREEIRDFVADDVDEEEEPYPLSSHRALHRETELEMLQDELDADHWLAAHYVRMEKRGRGDSNDDEENEVDASNDDEEKVLTAEDNYGGSESDVANGGVFAESFDEEEEEDEWQKSILSKRVAKRKSRTPRKRSGRRVSMSETKMSPKKRATRDTQSSDDEVEFLETVPATVIRKPRLAIQDSDDED